MVYITGHTFTNRLTNHITAKVYANCDSVTLFLNGNSQGSVTSTNCIFTWPVTLSGGTNFVEAIGRKGGKDSVLVRDSLEWVLQPAKATASTGGTLQDPGTNSNTILSAISTNGLARKD